MIMLRETKKTPLEKFLDKIILQRVEGSIYLVPAVTDIVIQESLNEEAADLEHRALKELSRNSDYIMEYIKFLETNVKIWPHEQGVFSNLSINTHDILKRMMAYPEQYVQQVNASLKDKGYKLPPNNYRTIDNFQRGYSVEESVNDAIKLGDLLKNIQD